jgi:hypothetical protein
MPNSISVIFKNSTASSHLRTPSVLENKSGSASFKVITRAAIALSNGEVGLRGAGGARGALFHL